MNRKIPPGSYLPLMGGEYLRALILFFWALWIGAFARFDQAGGGSQFSFFEELAASEWIWAGALLAVSSYALAAAWFRLYLSRFVGQALIAISWGWIAGGFAAVNWESSAVPVFVGLSLYSIFGLIWIPLVGVYRRDGS